MGKEDTKLEIEYFIMNEKWDGSKYVVGHSTVITDNICNEEIITKYKGQGYTEYEYACISFTIEVYENYIKESDIIKVNHFLNTIEVVSHLEFKKNKINHQEHT